ncbi:hypothetical protein BH11MYX1_BH11MYX1_14770 [soil metagenome]
MLMVAAVFAVMAGTASSQVWQDHTAECLGTTGEWSNKIELADLDGDGTLDILVANGSGYASPGPVEPTRVWRNLGNWTGAAPHCMEVSATTLMSYMGRSRMIKAADVDGDGDLDLVTGGAYQTQAKLFLNNGDGTWLDASAQLPQQLTSIGDAEVGDVDGDGDLDLVLVDWGAQNPGTQGYAGGPTRLYLNDGTGHFTVAPRGAMPAQLIKWSWDLTLADVDNDWDLDVLVSCKECTQSYLFTNDGTGHFTNQPNALPHFTNNYALEPMDVDGDGYLDLATINDGNNGENHLFMNKHDGTFADETTARMTATANPHNVDDNAPVFLDVDNDGDVDMLVVSLGGSECLLINDGSGHFTLAAGSATPDDTPGSLGIAVGDLDGDGRLDVVQSQGEVAFPEKVQLASPSAVDGVAIDTQPPVIAIEKVTATSAIVRARIHDHQSPGRPSDFKNVVLKYGSITVPMQWYGEYLWIARRPLDGYLAHYQVCATDRAGNSACTDADTGNPVDAGTPGGADNSTAPMQPGGCCDTGSSSATLIAPLLFFLFSARSRANRRGCCSPTPDRR